MAGVVGLASSFSEIRVLLFQVLLKTKWLGMRDLILNPSKYIVYLTNFDVNTAETILEAHGHTVTI